MANTIMHHPPDDTVLRYACGTLPEAPAIVVATHLSFCPACRRRMQSYEILGGSMLDDAAPAQLSADALSSTLSRLDGMPADGHRSQPTPRRRPDLPTGMEWPAVLGHYDIPGWRFALPGVKWTAPSFDSPEAGQLLIIRGVPGAKLPAHGHDGTEYTCVLTGSFSDSNGVYKTGDLIEATEDHDHQPIVGGDAECICVIAIDGHLRLHGLARLLQPFLGL